MLREAREDGKLSIRDVADKTKIVPKYIDALENEDYTKFPGETYVLGFLRSYSDFLQLDTEHVVQLFHGQQIDQSQAPLRELTRPMHSRIYMERNFWLVLAGAGVIACGLLFFLFGPTDITLFSDVTSDDTPLPCAERRMVPITLTEAADSHTLSGDNALRFTVDTLGLQLCLQEIRHDTDAPEAEFTVRVNDGVDYNFRARENETILLNGRIDELSAGGRKLYFTPRVLADISASIEIKMTRSEESALAEDIRVTLQFINNSYFEWMDDGNTHKGLSMSKGQVRTLEAKNRLELKLGNGGGVRILREGQLPRLAGPSGKIIIVTYKKVPDPLDPGISTIVETIEVVR